MLHGDLPAQYVAGLRHSFRDIKVRVRGCQSRANRDRRRLVFSCFLRISAMAPSSNLTHTFLFPSSSTSRVAGGHCERDGQPSPPHDVPEGGRGPSLCLLSCCCSLLLPLFLPDKVRMAIWDSLLQETGPAQMHITSSIKHSGLIEVRGRKNAREEGEDDTRTETQQRSEEGHTTRLILPFFPSFPFLASFLPLSFCLYTEPVCRFSRRHVNVRPFLPPHAAVRFVGVCFNSNFYH